MRKHLILNKDIVFPCICEHLCVYLVMFVSMCFHAFCGIVMWALSSFQEYVVREFDTSGEYVVKVTEL